MNLIGAVDIGGTKIAVGLLDAAGQVLEAASCPTEPEKGFDDGLERIGGLLRTCLSSRPQDTLQGIGVGCTGPVDPHTGVLGPNSFLPLWEGVGMIDAMQKAFNVPVAIENDADAAALGEYTWGAGQGAQRFLYLTVSTGIGGGLIIDGEVYRGAGGAHPELGHLMIEAGVGEVCYCGGRGCWESLASGPALAAWYNSQTGTSLDARAVCQRALQGEDLARQTVEREGRYLGLGLANMINAFVPDVIVLGGGVMASWALFEQQVHATIRQNCQLVPYERTELRLASLGAQTGLAGAACVFYHTISTL